MGQYRVRYEIDVEAETPVAAAWEAHRLMKNPEAMLPYLEVSEQRAAGVLGPPVAVDLDQVNDEA